MILLPMTYSSFPYELLHGAGNLPVPDLLLLLQCEGFVRVERTFLKKIEMGHFKVAIQRGNREINPLRSSAAPSQ
jgi:hypothetical protein